MTFNLRRVAALAVAGLAFGLTTSADAAFLPDGEYFLHNHPGAAETPPPYGLRLDELYNTLLSHEIYTFDFDDARSDMRLTVSGSGTMLQIHGVVWGGRDVGGAYAADAYQGLYTVNFLYSMGVGDVPGDDDTWVTGADFVNTGTIMTPLGDTFYLADKNSMDATPYTFRLGNDDDDLGYRGVSDPSGWGWVAHSPVQGQYVHQDYSDWLFVVGDRVPSPGSFACVLAGAGLVASRRRRA